ncbi:helix-turn-helix domain-containing protein [Lentilitoribacter sp. EG35]|uniref:helix-turn-helix domain-containing protein n=1 Tax=Lentilitoribacter sp. EG35 TaxID=3234192 RepID=UPI003460710A
MPQSSIGMNWAVFGHVVKTIRETLGVSQRVFCEQLPGVSPPVLSRIERGNPAEIGPYLMICRELDIHPYDIIEIGPVTVDQLKAASKQKEDA